MSDNNEIILEVKNLNISFGKPKERTYVVQDLSFDYGFSKKYRNS